MLPWLLTLLAIGVFASVLRPTDKMVTVVPGSAVPVHDPSPGRYNLTLQYPDHKYSPDVATVKNLRPVQQRNVMLDGDLDKEYSWLSEDVGQGNPISWSNWPNPVAPYRPGHNSLCYNLQRQLTKPYRCPPKGQHEVVIQGHSVPLAHELYSSRDEGDTIVPFGRMRSNLLCCPSTYHTDQGCVCGL